MDFNSKYCIENPINVAIVGRINLKAGRDVKIGEEVSIYELFGGEELQKEFIVESDIELDKTKLKINVEKVGEIECIADAFKKKGAKASIWNIMKYKDMSMKIKSTREVEKGENLSITIETI